MFPLFETICIDNGRLQNLEWHQRRYWNSFRTMYGESPSGSIADNIVVPEEYCSGMYKLRISYNKKSTNVEYQRYSIKKISTLQLTEDNEICYDLKYSNRNRLEDLFGNRNDCDDILIVKNGVITDSSYCNIVLFDGNDWVTPSSPLLKGTARERLLEQKIIREGDIRPKDLVKYICFKLVNAMRDFNIVEESNIKNIKE